MGKQAEELQVGMGGGRTLLYWTMGIAALRILIFGTWGRDPGFLYFWDSLGKNATILTTITTIADSFLVICCLLADFDGICRQS